MFACLFNGVVLTTDRVLRIVVTDGAAVATVWGDGGFNVFFDGTETHCSGVGAFCLKNGVHDIVFSNSAISACHSKSIGVDFDSRCWRKVAVTFSTLMRFLQRSKTRYVWATVRGHTAVGLKRTKL